MRASLTASLLLALGLMRPISVSLSSPPEDLEGSGHDLDSSGSGDGSEQAVSPGENKNIKDQLNSKDERRFAANAGDGNKNNFHGSSGLTSDSINWPAGDIGSELVLIANNKSFLENKDIFAGVIAGGVIGMVLATTLAAILIYKWQKKDEEGRILSQQRASEEDYHKPIREEADG